jgi:hypothetical protein
MPCLFKSWLIRLQYLDREQFRGLRRCGNYSSDAITNCWREQMTLNCFLEWHPSWLSSGLPLGMASCLSVCVPMETFPVNVSIDFHVKDRLSLSRKKTSFWNTITSSSTHLGALDQHFARLTCRCQKQIEDLELLNATRCCMLIFVFWVFVCHIEYTWKQLNV